MGVLDELRIIVSPVALGTGRSVMSITNERIQLELLRTTVFKSGNVLLTYKPTSDNKDT